MEVISVVGQAILSAALQELFKKLTSSDLLKLARKEQIHVDFKRWEKLLMKIHAVLEDAEEKQMTNGLVKIWLGELRDLAYDMEDMLDDFTTEAMKLNLPSQPEQRSTSKTCKLIFTCFTSGSPHLSMFRYKMRDINERLKQIASEKDDLDLKENYNRGYARFVGRIPTTSLVDECYVYGRENDKEAIVELLLGQEVSDHGGVSVIPIIGMGGVGKTTLTQLLYNDSRVNAFFELKAWVCVSEDFNIVKVTRTILEAISLERFDKEDLNLLQLRLKEKLSGKKFLLVLDDVWNENYDSWDVLRRPLVAAGSGSKVLVTTRNGGVVSVMASVPAYCAGVLDDDDCLSLFAQHALGARTFDSYPLLKPAGEEIAKRCKGLPLAAKALGGLLRSRRNLDEWENILNSKIWRLPEDKTGILPVLRLSYHHLPSHLKQCFAYCAIFPKDYEFDENELVLLWMAEGFLQQPEGNMQIEDLGLEYFHELKSRSFFQQSSSNSSRFVMHDLIHDLAHSISAEVCFNLDDRLEGDKFSGSYEKIRHSTFSRQQYGITCRFDVFHKMKNLRTFLSVPSNPDSDSSWCYLSSFILHDLLPKLKCLRVLSLSGYWIKELPESIGYLKHLRHLDLSHCAIQCLPESVSELSNLLTLILRKCRKLAKLPVGTGDLIKLHHLDISCTANLRELPSGIGKLLDLQTLPKFIVGAFDRLQIQELKDLNKLRKKLSIIGLHNVVKARNASYANLKEKASLDELSLEWCSDFHESRNVNDELQILDVLQPHQNLKKLIFTYFGGVSFPHWVDDPSFSCLRYLEFHDCKKSISLPSLGRLPALQDLRIKGMDAMVSVGNEFYGDLSPSIVPFSALKSLKFEDMLNWEEWSFNGYWQFPALLELNIQNCPKLVGKLYGIFPSLDCLHICRCPCLEDLNLNLPLLRELDIRECNGLVLKGLLNLTSLTTLKIGSTNGLAFLDEGLLRSLEALEVLDIHNCGELTSLCQDGASTEELRCLKHLEIQNCPKFFSFGKDEECNLPQNLEVLNIVNCSSLEKLPNRLHCLTCLKILSIRRCSKLACFPDTGFPCSLKRLQLINCDALQTLPHEIMMRGNDNSQHFLEELEIQACNALLSFPVGRLITNLKSLAIRDCSNVQSLPEGITYTNVGDGIPLLQELTVSGCSSVASFPDGSFPAFLKTLHIWGCVTPETFPGAMVQHNTSLECINIWNCVNLKIFQLDSLHGLLHLSELEISCCPSLCLIEGGLHIQNLKSLKVENCENLKLLPNMQNLRSLDSLIILDCPSLTSFPEGGLPSNLIKLEIWNCQNVKQPVSEWGLFRRRSSLQRLHIVGTSPPQMVSFPDYEGFLLPATLKFLYIERLSILESLSKGIRDLTSLEQLWIMNCPHLWSLPKEGLPASLGQLYIGNCPLLKRRCLKEKGEYWPIIRHIPCIIID